MKITPKNWRDFQHYKDRNPPWIRLHKGLLDNFEFQSLPVASRALAPMLWLLASDSVDGLIDAEPKKLAFRLRMSLAEVVEALKPLIDNGFFVAEQAASKPLADGLRGAVPETETEAETEAFTETDSEAETEAGFEAPPAGDASPPVAAVVPIKAKPPKQPAQSAEAWAAYSEAYRLRYQTDPVRNATVNAQMAQVVSRLGASEAPEVARFFLAHRGAFYVKAMHSVGSLLSDCEKLRTEWATGRQMTHTQAMTADKTQTNLNAFGPLIQAAQEREANERESQHG
jgi:hypothetical protein